MALPDLVPLDDATLADAAALLAERHARHRAAEPLLPAVTDFGAQLRAELARDGAAGIVALRGGEPVAYVAGAVEDGIARVGLAGCAARAGAEEAVRDCYAALAARWAAAGCRRHQAMVPATDAALVDAWFRLAFGCQFTTGVREVGPVERFDGGVSLRPSTPDDLPHIAAFDRLLHELQAGSPSFSGIDVGAIDVEAEWSDLWDAPEELPLHLLAERDGRVVGHLLLYVRPNGDLRVPERNIDLAHAATADDARGTGAMGALLSEALRWAHERGYRSVTTDWRSANLLSSRYWPGRGGFRPTFYRLYHAFP
jgi:GNAT superfamily N-acetyltransferase